MPGGSGGAQQSGSTTTTQGPPAYQYPQIGTAQQQADQILAHGGPQYYPGQTVAQFSGPQQAAMSGILDLGMNGTPGLDAEGNFDQTLLQGGGSNPYMDAMFNHMAGATQNQLSGEFAGMGRNASASEPLRAEQLNNLATGFYGGQYQNNIQDALQAGNQAQSLYGTRLGGMEAAQGVGQEVQDQAQKLMDANRQKYDYYQNLPEMNLQQFLQNLNGMQPGTATNQPYFTNPTANALGEGESLAGLIAMLKGMGGSSTADAAAG